MVQLLRDFQERVLQMRWVLSLGQLGRAGAGVREGAGAAIQADCALLKQLPLPGAPRGWSCMSLGRKRGTTAEDTHGAAAR